MKTLNYMKVLLLCILTLSFASCGDDVYYTMENNDDKLCGKTWVKESQNAEGLPTTYQLRFFKDKNKGQELSITYDAGGKVTIDREFTWQWTDDSKEALKLTFADNKVKYFDNVWVRDHYLSGELNGEMITLVDANYKK